MRKFTAYEVGQALENEDSLCGVPSSKLEDTDMYLASEVDLEIEQWENTALAFHKKADAYAETICEQAAEIARLQRHIHLISE